MTPATFSFTSATARTRCGVMPVRQTPARRAAIHRRMALDVVAVVVLAGVAAALALAVTALVKLPLPAGPDLGRLVLDGRLLAGR